MRLKTRSAVALLVASLMVGVTGIGYGGEEPPVPGSEQLIGPGTVGTLTITDSGSIHAEFQGQCRGVAVFLAQDYPFSFSDVTADSLDGFRPAPTSAVPQCGYPAGELIIIAVSRFSKTATVAVAEIVMMGVIPK